MSDLRGKDRLIFALDVPTAREALDLVEELEGLVSFFKVGLELLLSGDMRELLERLKDKQVFVDFKLPDDIEATVRRVVERSTQLGVEFLTLSASAAATTIRAAREGRGNAERPKLLYVSYLSGLDSKDYAAVSGDTEVGFKRHLCGRADMALEAGCDGLIASGEAIRVLREHHENAIIVAPGIRPSGFSTDDHKRFATPYEAIMMRADYLVVGRPIRNAPDRKARRERAKSIIDEIDSALKARDRQSSADSESKGSGGSARSAACSGSPPLNLS